MTLEPQHGAALHALQAVAVDQVAGAVVQRAVQADDVALGQQLVQGHVAPAQGFHRRVGVRVVGQQGAAEAGHDAGEHFADLPGACSSVETGPENFQL
ncbi:hypothetical protein V0R61_21345 [Aeromonas sp. 43P]|nr:hypothetical protein [Aeromonas sp. 43P]MEE1955810.1 hypothetical protein [Aeromonas sp. 43P]